MRRLEHDWEFNVLGVENYRRADTKLRGYFDFIIEHHHRLPGDVCEAGVFRGRSLLATAMLLTELGSAKKVYGYDTFSGFPGYHDNDAFERFDDLLADGTITQDFYDQVQRNRDYRQTLTAADVTPANVSSSGDFSDSPLPLLRKKIGLLGLTNIELVEGPFGQTMADTAGDAGPRFMAALVDCDLYEGHRDALPFIWSRLTHGGYVFLDEYYSLKFPGARIATDAFFADRPDKPQRHRVVPSEFERWYVRKLGE